MNPFDLDTTNIDDRIARVLLATISPPGSLVIGDWVGAFGAVETLRHALGDHPVEGAEPGVVTEWRASIREYLADHDAVATFFAGLAHDPLVLVPTDPGWPTGLNDLGDWAPLALWADGDTSVLTAPRTGRVAIVGSQAPSDYGTVVTRHLARDLVGHNKQVVSGGAHGIDTEAHRDALVTGGTTIAVVAGGLKHPFPPSNTELFQRIRNEGGVLLTEVPPSMPATNRSAGARHRITAALSGIVVAVEPGRRSEAVDTCTEAIAVGRPVAAVPGPVTSVLSAGAHLLIRDWGAALVTDAADVVRLLGRDAHGATTPGLPVPSPRPTRPTGPSL